MLRAIQRQRDGRQVPGTPTRLAVIFCCVFQLPAWAATPQPQEALFLFQRCAGLYYTLSQYAVSVEGEMGRELQQQFLTDARAAENAAMYFRTRLHEQRHPEVEYSREQYAEWQTSLHDNALTIANQTYQILIQSGAAVVAQELVPCTELYPLQSAIARGDME